MDENLESFLRVLDPDDNTTGGGTASSVAGAMAGGLVAMVARLSIGKKYERPDKFFHEIATEAHALSTALFEGGRLDSKAFDAVIAGYRMPKGNDEQKAARNAAIQQAMIEATLVPLTNADRCWEVFELAGKLEGCSNPNAASDLECARHLARAGVLGCIANVKINVPSIKDEMVAENLLSKAEALMDGVSE
jgi:formiminotetrahydrofolate cyclodeaminase